MSSNDIVFTFFTIMYGLMLTDLFLSMHRLIKNTKSVAWHWLPVLTAWYMFLTILNNWWDLAQSSSQPGSLNIYVFIAYGHLFVLLFLLVSSALPDVEKDDEVDLKTYYFQNHRYFWGLMTAVLVVSIVIQVFKRFHELETANLLPMLSVFILPSLTITLAISRRPALHKIIVTILVVGVVMEITSVL